MLNLNDEIFVTIAGYEGLYQVSNFGRISNHRKSLKFYQTNSGYWCVKLRKNGKSIAYLVHRLVATHFLKNPDFKPEVNHKDGHKSNNTAANLEWVTSVENKAHAKTLGLKIYNEPSKGIKLGNTSKFHNVLWDSNRKKWIGVVRHQSKNHFAKRFDSEIDAAKHVNWILDELGLMNRPRNII